MIIGEWQLRMPSDVETIICDIRNQKLVLRNLSQDSLSIDASVSVAVEDCDFKAFNVLRCANLLNLQRRIVVIYIYISIILMGRV